MTVPRVSVVIPVYNREAAVGRAIDSVLTQSFRDLEVLVIDDASTDGSAAAVKAIRDPRLQLLRSPRRGGAAMARNLGLRAARGEYVAFLDSDDFWLPDKLLKQVHAMEAAPARAAASCTGFVVHRVGSDRRVSRVPSPQSDWFSTLLDGCTISPGSTLMVRRAVLEHVGLFDTALQRLEDWDWLLRYLDRGELMLVPEVLAEIAVASHPPPAAVAEATRTLFAANVDRVRRRCGNRGVRRFRASLLIERSVAHIRCGELVRGAVLCAGTLGLSPNRVLGLVARGLAKMRQRDF